MTKYSLSLQMFKETDFIRQLAARHKQKDGRVEKALLHDASLIVEYFHCGKHDD